jgi:AcrR family transcriptional regulator
MDDIIVDAGGSKATIYGYFQSKEKLFKEVIRQQVRGLGRLLFDLPEETSHVEAALTEFGKKMIVLLLDDTTQALKRICVHEADKFPELRCIFYEGGPKMIIDRLGDFIRRAHRNGDLNAPDSEMAAWQFTLLCQAKHVHPCVIMGRGKPTMKQIKTAIDAAVRTFMAAYGCKKKSS